MEFTEWIQTKVEQSELFKHFEGFLTFMAAGLGLILLLLIGVVARSCRKKLIALAKSLKEKMVYNGLI